jgi:hypothetical protein
LVHGPIPDGLFVCHKCDTPACVNAETHLFLGTHQENMADMVAKGRQARGERGGQAKLEAEQVLAIRERYAAGETSKPSLGREYGVHSTTIGKIVRGESWSAAA